MPTDQTTAERKGLIIGGQEIFTDSEFAVLDKYTGDVIANVAKASKEHINQAVSIAQKTFDQDQLTPYQRYEILKRAAEILKERKEDVAFTLSREVGKTITDARGEVDRAIQTLTLSSEEAKRIDGEIIPISASPGAENRMGYAVRAPLGVIGAITPFNFPFNLACHKIGPAIASGNTVVWKPASDTATSAYHLMNILKEAGLPSGYVNLVCGSGSQVGGWLLEDERIAKYTFTGSAEVGRYIKENSGLRPVSLELGNNSPNIVHHDADLDLAAKMCVLKGFNTAGQACISVQRILVHSQVYDQFLDKLREETEQLKVGNPLDAETNIGPLISKKEADRVMTWINEAVSQGAKMITGGKQDGSIVTPTILSDVNHEMKVVCQEIFGPVITVMPFDDIDDAIEHANNSNYGLQSGIFTTNINTAMEAVKKFRTGGVIINDASTFRADAMPYGGIKDSGIGKEGPRYAIEEMTFLKTVIINL
ncbi:aldehyde dehydrogenase family protein [Aeromicrobium ponti]|uniref:3-sulfolactaldehyde dehydrogenase n=1 Tax=Cytobacillus oceanisediminis TaxID=665099 RepID=A0A562K2M6_9BACI|nr:aldehyde dehydrogenase family protein [Cytobacillus oceanisediminis]TWH89682.1 acyl-CoA reductase-like NAD-dependent aldehyde dehydrogenase [Cytobacillus oceanisediminis]